MTYDKTNRGALFKNDRRTSDNHPDLSGQININGTDYWLSGWYKKTETGAFKVLSLSVKPKEQRPEGGRKAPQNPVDEPRGNDRRESLPDDDFDALNW